MRWSLGHSELVLIGAFWTFYALLTAANRLLDPRGPGLEVGIAWGPVAPAFFESFLWALLTPGIFWLSSRLSLDRSHWVRRGLGLLVAALAVSLFVDVTGDIFRVYALDVPRWHARGVSPLRSVARLWFLDDLILFVAILAAGFAREYFVRYRMRRDETIQLQAQAARLQAQLAEARLQTLRMQVNPHFLFNTLHAVSSLVERDPRGVRRMIARLSELLRYTLEGVDSQEVALEQEMDFLRRYLEIMTVRFQGRLEVDLQVSSEALTARVPNLILQPLVENAIKHGVGNLSGPGLIVVHAERAGQALVLEVRDNGPGLPDDAADEGVGLRNTRARLAQLYGDAQSLTLRTAPAGGAVAEIRLPYHTAADLHTAQVAEQHEWVDA